MIQVERHFHTGNPEIVRLCQTAKVLYNRCNYHIRKAYAANQNLAVRPALPDISALIRLVENEDCFKNLHNTKTAKQTIRRCLTDWSNYFKALKAYKKCPDGFLSKPKIPYYKNKMAQVIFYNETIKKKPLKQGIISPTNDCFSIVSRQAGRPSTFKQVVITPKTFGFVIEVSYEVTPKQHRGDKLDKNKVCCIDIGLNTLAAIASDQHLPILINGRILKGINQWYNKNPSKKRSRKRYWRMENYFHHASNFIIANCLKHGIGKIIIGKNDGWKQEMNMGKKNNQHFQYIPFINFLQKIKYKADLAGIEVVFTEEANTSKCSFLDRDVLPAYKHGEVCPSGKRVHRGLYKSQNGILLNADINGSGNIGRKVIPNLGNEQWDRSLAARPVVVNPLNN
jgi:IS605 OrfB family transposase